MKKIPAQINSSPPKEPLVYRLVFEHVLARVFVVVLLCSFSLQTVERVFAADEEIAQNETPLISITDETLSTINSEIDDRLNPLASSDGIDNIDGIDNDPIANVEQESVASVSENVDNSPGEIENQNDSTEAEVRTGESSGIQVGSDDATNSENSNNDSGVVSDASVLFASSSTDTLSDNVGINSATSTFISSTSASTTDESVPTLVVESDQMIQFNKESCLAVEDGSFYCQTATTTIPAAEKGLFSLPDVDGDLEIYIKNGEEMKQITFNKVDDASPYYDSASDSIVWHRIVDERYQIVVYDVASGEETQLTDTSTNNMEPFRSDNIIVWQHWDKDAWQIMLYDGDNIKQLTSTVEHNLAPVVRNNLVVWHRIMYGEKTIEVYDLSSGAYMTIQDDEGTNISNPRMVLVYDASMDNGDVVTRGYDLVTGEITSFEDNPTPMPEEIPEPESTGETKALLNTKSGSEDESDDGLTSTDAATSSTDLTILPGLSSSTNMTLDLSGDVSGEVSELNDISPQIPDLVIPSFVSSTSPIDIPVVE